MSNLPDRIYTPKEMETARARGRWVGRVQGAGVVIGGAVLWNLLGWIPALIALAAVGWVLYKLFGSDKDAEAEAED